MKIIKRQKISKRKEGKKENLTKSHKLWRKEENKELKKDKRKESTKTTKTTVNTETRLR